MNKAMRVFLKAIREDLIAFTEGAILNLRVYRDRQGYAPCRLCQANTTTIEVGYDVPDRKWKTPDHYQMTVCLDRQACRFRMAVSGG